MGMKNIQPFDGMILSIRSPKKSGPARLMQMASADVARQRLDKCRFCEHIRRPIDQCKLCGCFMQIKARIDSASCPEGRW